MNLKISTIVVILVWCLFMGVTAISIGVGAVFPQLNYIAGPVVCPGGSMSTQQQGYQVSPVESVTTITMYCNNARTGASNEVGLFPIVLVAGPIYGLLLFFVVLAVMLVRGLASGPAADDRLTASALPIERGNPTSEDSSGARAKIEELRELRDANQISDAVYEKRKQELLSKTPGREP